MRRGGGGIRDVVVLSEDDGLHTEHGGGALRSDGGGGGDPICVGRILDARKGGLRIEAGEVEQFGDGAEEPASLSGWLFSDAEDTRRGLSIFERGVVAWVVLYTDPKADEGSGGGGCGKCRLVGQKGQSRAGEAAMYGARAPFTRSYCWCSSKQKGRDRYEAEHCGFGLERYNAREIVYREGRAIT